VDFATAVCIDCIQRKTLHAIIEDMAREYADYGSTDFLGEDVAERLLQAIKDAVVVPV
jgi:uncharacterized protein YheU (UPF0270 family)